LHRKTKKRISLSTLAAPKRWSTSAAEKRQPQGNLPPAEFTRRGGY